MTAVRDVGIAGCLIAAGFVVTVLYVAGLTPNPQHVQPEVWLLLGVQLLVGGFVAVDRRP